jgi:aminopeptidase N
VRESAGGPDRDVLRRDEAIERARLVRRVAYTLSIDLAAGSETYRGRTIIELDRVEPDRPLFLDFSGRLTDLRVNGRAVEPDHRGHRLWLPPGSPDGRDRIEVDLHNAFDTTGSGVHRFVDPEDGLEYLYSNFEPFSAHRVFPCFDQPDIKATYTLDVTAPRSWRVISSMPVGQESDAGDDRVRHRFGTTPPFSTYVLALMAGPWERAGSEHAGTPLGLYGRRSMRPELERAADEIFEVTAQGLDHFRGLFGRRYVFDKYDQLFVPEFNAGAMENVAAVTFHDSFLFRDPPTWSQRLERAEVVLHELAHMWFGDLVTMRWWDDLWLNETFATYAAYHALAEATRFEDAWRVFNGQMRPAAVRQDQLVTTHPIAADVGDTDGAQANFDAITYEKGAAVIKQLVAALGEDVFREGVQTYVQRHAWGNADLHDFLAALSHAAGTPLDDWATAWLERASLNTIGVGWTERDGRIESMTLHQRAPEAHPTLRPHATTVGLVQLSDQGTGLVTVGLPARISDARADVPEARGLRAPLFVFPNHGDHDYAIAALDEASVAFALERLPDLDDPMLRQQTWSALWDMVRDGQLRVGDFLAAVERFAPGEGDDAMLTAVLDRADTALNRYVPEQALAETSARLFAVAMDALRSVEEPGNRITWARSAISFANREADIGALTRLVDGESVVDGFRLDQDMRWSVLIKGAAFDLDDAGRRLGAEASRDPSDRGDRAAVRANASWPDPATKVRTWESVHGEGYGSDYRTRAAMAGFLWRHQRDLLAPYRLGFFDRVRDVYRTHDHAFSRSYVRWLVPDRWAEPDVAARVHELVGRLDDSEVLLSRQLREVADDLERAIRVRAVESSATLGPDPAA